jgi:hypothetical protein
LSIEKCHGKKKKSVARDSHLLRAAALLMKSQHAFSSHAHVHPSFPSFSRREFLKILRHERDDDTTTTTRKKQNKNKKGSEEKSSSRNEKDLKHTGERRARAVWIQSATCVCVLFVSTHVWFSPSKRVGDESTRRE